MNKAQQLLRLMERISPRIDIDDVDAGAIHAWITHPTVEDPEGEASCLLCQFDVLGKGDDAEVVDIEVRKGSSQVTGKAYKPTPQQVQRFKSALDATFFRSLFQEADRFAR